MIKAYLFDFDYTLVDSSPAIVHCFNAAFEKEGLPKPDEGHIKKLIGMPLEGMAKALHEGMDDSLVEKIKSNYVAEADLVATRLTYFFPDVRSSLGFLKMKGCQTGIVSTKFRYRIVEALEANQMSDLFTLIIGGEDVSSHKPDPEGILIAIERLKLTREEVIFVGDSLFDYYAAQNAGVQFRAILNGATTAAEFIANGCKKEDILMSLGELENDWI